MTALEALKLWRKYDETLNKADAYSAYVQAIEATNAAIKELEQPDCRLCAHHYVDEDGIDCCDQHICTNGDKLTPAEPVRLYE